MQSIIKSRAKKILDTDASIAENSSMAQRYILAIDQGTTGSTALVFNSDAQAAGRGYSEFTQHYPRPGWVEHDPMEIWNVTLGVIRQALSSSSVAPCELAALGITNQRETCLLWDRKTGEPVTPAIVWQDRRTADLCSDLKAEGLEPEWQRNTGLLLDPYFSGTKLSWMLENDSGLRKRASSGELAFGTIDSWLVWKLTGGRRHVTDVSNASRTLLYNIKALEWDAGILDRLGVPGEVLPEVVASSGVCGETDPSLFDGVSLPIAGIAGDQQAALFGQACYSSGMLKNTYGTGSFLLMNTGEEPIDSKERLLTTIAWQLEGKRVQYALEGSIFITGAGIQWLRDGLQIIESAKDTEALARSLRGNDDVYFVPALAGLGAPYWDPYARGIVVGLTRGTTRAHLARAALEAIAYQTRDVAEAMSRESRIPLAALRADGGAVANRFLMQFQSDLLNVPVEIPAVTETTALGAAYLAGLAVGYWKDIDDLQGKWKREASYEPLMERDERDALYSRWKKAVERARDWTEHKG